MPGPTGDEGPTLHGVGTSVPGHISDQALLVDRLASLWSLEGARLEKWTRILDGSGIKQRRSVLPIEDVIGMSTGQRMAAFETHAPALALDAARRVIDRTGLDPDLITDVVVVSCTGFSSPGVDVALVDGLGLRPSVRRLQVGFMGCFGGITGLRAAAAACAADPGGVALMVCVELCTLHLRPDRSAQNMVASALFSDGAAAAVVSGRHAPMRSAGTAGPPSIVAPGTARLLGEGRDRMSWRITDEGFAMTLDRRVPEVLRSEVGELLAPFDASTRRLAVHPGGAAILDAVDAGLHLDGAAGIDAARAVLHDHGNMSSGTVLFVLDRLRERTPDRPVTLLAFGPGLTVETLELRPRA